MSDARQTVSGAYDKIAAHEDLCAERYKNINTAIVDLKGDVGWILKGVVAVLIAVVGWLATQVYNGVKTPALAAEKPALSSPHSGTGA